MKFSIEDYPGKYAMHCKTEEEAKSFCDYLHSIGRTWRDKRPYTTTTQWKVYAEDTAYNFHNNSYCCVSVYQGMGYQILEWEDFMKQTFTKANLKSGDIVMLNDGEVGVVITQRETIVFKEGYAPLDNYHDDMTFRGNKKFSIKAVRRPVRATDCQFDAFDENLGTLVYEREEVEEMTLEQVCAALGKTIKIVKG